MQKAILSSFILFFCLLTYSQNAKFSYWSDGCDCIGQFDSTKITRTQLQNTYEVLWNAPNIEYSGTTSTPDKVSLLDTELLWEECNERINLLKTLDFIDDPFWNQLKQKQINYYKATCLLREYTIRAYSNPEVLLKYDLVDEKCIYYRDILIQGGQKMIDAWKNYEKEWIERNGYAEFHQREYEQKYNSPQREDYARLTLMIYGWWNSANHCLPHLESPTKFTSEFNRLFNDLECECDIP